MKSKILLLLFVTALVACKTSKLSKTSKSDYFQGTITYDLSYKPKQTYKTEEELNKSLGTKMILFFKEGNTRKEYYSPDGSLLKTEIYTHANNTAYSNTHASDSILTYNPKNTDFINTVRKTGTKRYFNHDCDIIIAQGEPKPEFKDYPFITVTYYTSKQIKIDPAWFSGFVDGGFNEVTQLSNGFYLKSLVQMDYYNINREVSNISHEDVDSDLFIPKKDKPLKPI